MTSHPFTRLRPRLIARLAQERGQAMVELAVVLPVLLLIIVGIVSFGLYMNNQNQETQLAATAARFAAVDQNPSTTQTLQTYIQAQATGSLGSGSSDVTAARVYLYRQSLSSTGAPGSTVIACVISTVTAIPMLGVLAPTFQMVGATTMRVEAQQTTPNLAAGTGWTADTRPTSQCPPQTA